MAVVGDHDVAIFRGDALLSRATSAATQSSKLGSRGSRDQPADGMRHHKSAARLRTSRWVMMLAAIADSNIASRSSPKKGDRGDPHRRADAGGFLTAAAGRNSALQVDQDLPEVLTDSRSGTDERPFGRRQCQVKLGQPLLFDPAMINQDIAERQGLLRVVGVEPSQSPSIGLSFPGLNAIDVILHATVVSLDLLRCQAFQRSAERRRSANPSKHPRTRSIRDR